MLSAPTRPRSPGSACPFVAAEPLPPGARFRKTIALPDPRRLVLFTFSPYPYEENGQIAAYRSSPLPNPAAACRSSTARTQTTGKKRRSASSSPAPQLLDGVLRSFTDCPSTMSAPVPRIACLLLAAFLTGVGLLACGGSEEASDVVTDDTKGPIPGETDARQALDEALQAYNKYCLAPAAQGSEGSYPIELFNPSPNAPSFKYKQLWALTRVGLLDTSIVRGTRGLPVHRFSLTESGRASQYDIARGRSYEPMFCYAVPRVAAVDSIKAVYTSGPNPLANVWFTYSHGALKDWIRTRLVQRAFSGLPSPPSPTDTFRTNQLLVRVDSAWIDRRLTGFDRPPERPSP